MVQAGRLSWEITGMLDLLCPSPGICSMCLRWGQDAGLDVLCSHPAQPVSGCAIWRPGSRHLSVPFFVSALARPGLGFPVLNIFIAWFRLKAALWLTHGIAMGVDRCRIPCHWGNQENVAVL